MGRVPGEPEEALRQHLHRLVEALRPEDLPLAVSLLRRMLRGEPERFSDDRTGGGGCYARRAMTGEGPSAALEDRRIAEAVRRVAGAFGVPIVSAYLFGSRAEGRVHRESDLDLAILLPPGRSTAARTCSRCGWPSPPP